MTHHSLIRPLTPSDVLRSLVARSGWSLDATALCAGMSTRRLTKILDGKEPRLNDLIGLARALDRWMPALAQELSDARRAVREWERNDAELVAEQEAAKR